MKKIKLIVMLFLMMVGVRIIPTYGADVKFNDWVPSLTATTSPASTDIFALITDPTGTKVPKKLTLDSLKNAPLAQNWNAGSYSITAAGFYSTGSDGNNVLQLDNNTTRAPTASKMELYPEGNVWKVNNNGTEKTMGYLESPTLVTPVIGAATGTSLLASGLVDGTAYASIQSGTTYTFGSTYKAEYAFHDNASGGTYTLPTAAAGLQYCVKNYTGRTGALQVNTSASGQYIDLDGVNTASGGHIQSAGAAGDGVCLVGASTTNWVAYPSKGTWTKD